MCIVNQPYFACPDCAHTLVSPNGPTSKDGLIEQVEIELAERIAKEIHDREKIKEDERAASGAFPVLGGDRQTKLQPQNQTPIQNQRQPQNQSHKVMSLTGNKRGVTVSSYTTKPPVQASAATRTSGSEVDPEVVRIPPPHPPLSRQPRADVPFDNVISGNLEYLPSSDPADGSGASKRKSKKG